MTQIKLNTLVLLTISFVFLSCEKNEKPETTNSTEEPSSQSTESIESVLTTSKSNYKNASDGQWVLITPEEYDLLATRLKKVTKNGISDTQYNTSSEIISTTSTPSTLSNETITAIIPKNNYLFAFKYYAIKASKQNGFKVKKSSTSNKEGFKNIGEILPIHSGTNQSICFVLKGNNFPTKSTEYLGFYKPAGLKIGRKVSLTNNSYFIEFGDNSKLTERSTTRLQLMYQGLSTETKQW